MIDNLAKAKADKLLNLLTGLFSGPMPLDPGARSVRLRAHCGDHAATRASIIGNGHHRSRSSCADWQLQWKMDLYDIFKAGYKLKTSMETGGGIFEYRWPEVGEEIEIEGANNNLLVLPILPIVTCQYQRRYGGPMEEPEVVFPGQAFLSSGGVGRE